MTTRECIDGKIAEGIIPEEVGEELDRMEAARAGIDPDEAAFQAAMAKAEQLEREAARARKLTNLQIWAQDRLARRMDDHVNGPGAAVAGMITRELRGQNDIINVEYQAEVIRSQAVAEWKEALEKLRRTALGFKRNVAGEEALLRGLFGEEVDEWAKGAAEALTGIGEGLRSRFNRMGGAIPHLEDWHLPQSHNVVAVHDAGADAWKARVTPLLDRQKMVDFETGEVLDDAGLDELLTGVYESIRTGGLNKQEPDGLQRGVKLANRRQHRRILHFKDADSWLAYNAEFGEVDILQTALRHIDEMARDIALLETFGPNPEASFRFALQKLERDAALEGGFKMQDGSAMKAWHLQAMWNDVTGLANTPANQRVAKIGGAVRSGLAAAQLGSAFLSALSDTGTIALTAKFNGLPVTQVMGRLIQFAGDPELRGMAVQMGMAADMWTKIAGSQARYTGELIDSGAMAQVSNAVMKASLLSGWTDAGRAVFQMEFLGMAARLRSNRYGELPDAFRGALNRYGITPRDWNLIRESELRDWGKGYKTFDLVDLTKQGGELQLAAEKLHRMILTERDYAVVSVDARTRAALRGQSRPGTLGGEAARFFGMYKAFPVTILTTHLMRMINQQSFGSKAAYFMGFFIPMTMMGMVSMQAKQVVRGKDPMDMDDPAAWGAAIAQGGGVGIFGDFLLADQNRFGQTFTHTALGPGAGLLDDITRLSIGNVQEIVAGEDTHFGAELTRFAGRYTPGSSLWYARLGVERLILDELTLQADPKAHQKFRRLERKIMKENGQGYWWRPGDSAPRRAPDMEGAFE